MNQDKDQQRKERDDQSGERPTMSPSSVDSKNENADRDTPSASERVTPRAGDGLANEGTVVDYTQER